MSKTSKDVEHTTKAATAETKKEVHKEQAKDPHATTGTKAKAAAKVPGDKAEAEAHKNHPATGTTDKHHDHIDAHPTIGTTTSKKSLEKTTKDGTHITVKGAGPEIPSLASPPSNKQLDSVLAGAHHELEKEKPHLDSHGKQIVTSTQNVLDATSLLLREKNKDQRFQRLFIFTQGTAQGGSSEGMSTAAKTLMSQATGMGSKISNNSTDMISYIRETILNLTTSNEFRQLAIEFLGLLESSMGQLKTAAATTDANGQPLKGKKLKSQAFETDEDRLEEINEKLRVLLKRVGKNPQYRSVIENFMKYSEEIYDSLYHAKSNASGTKESDGLRKTLDEAWAILNDFVGDNKTVPKFKKNLQYMLEQIKRDEDLSKWLKDVKKLLTDLMEHPENAAKDQKQQLALIKSGQVFADKYRDDLNRLYTQAGRVVERIQTDPVIVNFQTQLEQLGKDIALNNQGQPDLLVLQKSMNVIRDLLVERFRKVLIDIPIERVHVQNDAIDLTLKDISIHGDGLVPSNIHVEMVSLSDFGLDRNDTAAQKFRLRIRVTEIQPHFKGVKFNFKKKTFPSLKDKGICDLIFEGKGLNIDVAVQFIVKSNNISKAVFENCTVDVDTVRLKLEEAKHNILGAMFAPMINSRLQTKVQSGIYNFVNTRVGLVIDQLNRWFATRPFETMLVKGNESIQTAHEKREKKSVEKEVKKETQKVKKELSAEERQKKKELKLKQQQEGTYVKVDKTHKAEVHQAGAVHQGGGSPRGAMTQQDAHLPTTAVAQPIPGQQQEGQFHGQHHHNATILQTAQHNPNITQTGQQTVPHFQHPPADYQPQQHSSGGVYNDGHQQHQQIPGQQHPGQQHPDQHQQIPGQQHPGQQHAGQQIPGQQHPGQQHAAQQHAGQHPDQQPDLLYPMRSEIVPNSQQHQTPAVGSNQVQHPSS